MRSASHDGIDISEPRRSCGATRARWIGGVVIVSAAAAMLLGTGPGATSTDEMKTKDTQAADTTTTRTGGRLHPIPVKLDGVPRLEATFHPIGGAEAPPERGQADRAGTCPPVVSSHTDADFTGGSFFVQAGFAEGEIAAASFTLDPSAFPLRVDLMEMIFATVGATVQTTTHWSILVWEGTPSPAGLIFQFSSDGVLLPHIVLPPGNSGVNVQVSVDPGDPDQIIVTDDGTHTFSFGYRIDQHNNQTQDPCLFPPPTCCNAFPTTDLSGLASPAGNWLFGVNCGPFGCPANGGWASFQSLPSFCTPSGDWVMRVTWTSLNCAPAFGACCLPTGACIDLLETDCVAQAGTFQGNGTDCATVTCPAPTVACCFAGFGCLDLTESDCIAAGGAPQGIGSDCASVECFPIGACCLIDASCVDAVDPDQCLALGGVFQGNNTDCGTTVCPDPIGACCFDTGFCLDLTEASCLQAGASWMGIGTDCTDANGNGQADACETPPCPTDLNGDLVVDVVDLLQLLAVWGPAPGDPADFNGDGVVDVLDLLMLLSAWGPC